jgi:hypothetical protein
VPDEGHALDELLVRAHHPVEPPEVVVSPRVARRERLAAVRSRGGADQPRPRRMQEIVDGLLEPFARDVPCLARLRPKAGPPEQPFGLLLPEGTVVDRNVGGGHWLMLGREASADSPLFV